MAQSDRLIVLGSDGSSLRVELDLQVELDPRIYYELARIGFNLKPIRIRSQVDGCILETLPRIQFEISSLAS